MLYVNYIKSKGENKLEIISTKKYFRFYCKGKERNGEVAGNRRGVWFKKIFFFFNGKIVTHFAIVYNLVEKKNSDDCCSHPL